MFSKCLFRDRLPLEEGSLARMLELKVRAPLQAFLCFSQRPVQSQCPRRLKTEEEQNLGHSLGSLGCCVSSCMTLCHTTYVSFSYLQKRK